MATVQHCPPRRKGQRYDKPLAPFNKNEFLCPSDFGDELVYLGTFNGVSGFGMPAIYKAFELHTSTCIIPCYQFFHDVGRYPAPKGYAEFVLCQRFSHKAVAI